MTGLDKITSQIQEEAEASAKERIEAAQKEAEQILADAKAACEAMEKEASDKAAALKTVQDGRIHSAAEQKRKTALLKAKQEIIAEIIGSAYQTLKEEDTASYFLTMEKLVKTYALADKGEIYFSAAESRLLGIHGWANGAATLRLVRFIEKVQPDVIALHSVHGFQQILLQKRHDSGDLCLRALPVFRGKGVDRQVLDADVLAVGGDPAEGLRPRLMSRGAWQPPLGGPAAIAVHNNRNMARWAGSPPRRMQRVSCLAHQISISSFSLRASSSSIFLLLSSVSF